MSDLSIIAKRPDLPVIVLVDNYELSDDDGTTAQGIYEVILAMIVKWDGRVYVDEDIFTESYCVANRRDGRYMKTAAEAHRLWKKHAKECIVCYCYGEMIPKGCEIK